MISVGLVAVTGDKVNTFYAEFTDFNINKCDDWVKEHIVSKLLFSKNECNSILINGFVGDSIFISTNLKEWLSKFESIEFWADFDVIDKPMLIELISGWNKIFCMYENDIDVSFNITYYKQSDYGNPLYVVKYNNIEIGIVSVQTINETTVTLHPLFSKKGFGANFYKWYSKTFNKKILQCKSISNNAYKMWKKLNPCIISLPEHLPNIKYDQFFDLHTYLKIKGIDSDINRLVFIGDLIKEIPGGQSHNALYDAHVNWKVYEKLNTL
jgi:hypothetical protein